MCLYSKWVIMNYAQFCVYAPPKLINIPVNYLPPSRFAARLAARLAVIILWRTLSTLFSREIRQFCMLRQYGAPASHLSLTLPRSLTHIVEL